MAAAGDDRHRRGRGRLGTVIEALLFRGLFNMGRHLQSGLLERFAAIAAC